MEKIIKTTICDSCFKEIQQMNFREARLSFVMKKWGGGSIGGNEDIFIQEGELCCECAHKLQRFIESEMKIKPLHP